MSVMLHGYYLCKHNDAALFYNTYTESKKKGTGKNVSKHN